MDADESPDDPRLSALRRDDRRSPGNENPNAPLNRHRNSRHRESTKENSLEPASARQQSPQQRVYRTPSYTSHVCIRDLRVFPDRLGCTDAIQGHALLSKTPIVSAALTSASDQFRKPTTYRIKLWSARLTADRPPLSLRLRLFPTSRSLRQLTHSRRALVQIQGRCVSARTDSRITVRAARKRNSSVPSVSKAASPISEGGVSMAAREQQPISRAAVDADVPA